MVFLFFLCMLWSNDCPLLQRLTARRQEEAEQQAAAALKEAPVADGFPSQHELLSLG